MKNTNAGNIETEGGSVHIGDVKNIFEGLSYLLVEHKEQLKNIETLLQSFKVDTALNLLEELENRVNEIEYNDKNKILSKIYFLKGSCKRELIGIPKEEAARDYLLAYKLNSADPSVRNRACVEYLNLNDSSKSLNLADEILVSDEYNLSAWFAKANMSTDLKAFIKTIPSTVTENYNFQLSLIHHIITHFNLNLLEDLADFGVQLDIKFEKYQKLTFDALEAWRLATDLAINKIFNDYPQRYIHGDVFILQENPSVNIIFDLLEKYVLTLRDTEIKDAIIHQRFFLAYFGYLLTNEKTYAVDIERIFPLLEKANWFYTFCYCQILNHLKEYKKSLEEIINYENAGGTLHSEVFLFKSALFHLTGRGAEVVDIFTNYLDSIQLIEDRNGFNILNAFLNILFNKVSDEVIMQQWEKVAAKNFKSKQLKSLLQITIQIRYLKKFDPEQSYETLNKLIKFDGFDTNWRNLISENLNSIGRRNEAIQLLEQYIDKTKISESLRFYIILLHEQLRDKADQTKGRYSELLDLLKMWRETAKYSDSQLLTIEHNLYTEINDLDSIEEIDAKLYCEFPSDEQYNLLYLNILERRKKLDKIKEVVNSITWDIANERFGVAVSIILLRNNIEVEKGFGILFQLASNPNNVQARKAYFSSSQFLRDQDLFKSYDEVKIGCWVFYMVGDQKKEIKIERETGLHGEFFGKKVGDVFTSVTSLSSKIISIRVIEILNDALHLLRLIQQEAHNPVNELGFESLQMPENISDFENFLKSHFGAQGTKEKEIKEKAFEDYVNYRIGFSEIARLVFRENYLDAYLHLTGSPNNKFTTLPSTVTGLLNKEDEIGYALDFSTILLFYFLEKEIGFQFSHKYVISFLLKNEIEKEIMELSSSPAASMSVQITDQFVRRFDWPEDHNEKKIEFLQSLLEWIDKHCTVDLVLEKLELLTKFSEEEMLGEFMKVLVDNLCLSERTTFRLITSDSTLFLFSKRINSVGNIVNPEKYLLTFYPEKCDAEFYKFLLKSNYLGINITLETLKDEFYRYISNGQNFYNTCLENLQYTVHSNPQIIHTVTKFLKDLYVMQALTTEQKNTYAFQLLSSALYGMPPNILNALVQTLSNDFKLMGNLFDEVVGIIKGVLNA